MMSVDKCNVMQENAHMLLREYYYDKKILPELNKCVHSQIDDRWYDPDINLAILKFYRFYPQPEEGVVQIDVLIKILCLSLLQIPSSDFKQCLYLLPESCHNIELIAILSKLADKLETFQYMDFWELFNANYLKLPSIPGLENKFREIIFAAIEPTFKEIPSKLICDFLKAPLESILNQFPELKVKDDMVILPFNSKNQSRSKILEHANDIQIPQLSRVLSSAMF